MQTLPTMLLVCTKQANQILLNLRQVTRRYLHTDQQWGWYPQAFQPAKWALQSRKLGTCSRFEGSPTDGRRGTNLWLLLVSRNVISTARYLLVGLSIPKKKPITVSCYQAMWMFSQQNVSFVLACIGIVPKSNYQLVLSSLKKAIHQE